MLDWKLRKGVIDSQKVLHTRADYQDDLVTTSAASIGTVPVISTLWPSIQTLIFSIGLMVGGIALIIVSFVYKPRQPSETEAI